MLSAPPLRDSFGGNVGDVPASPTHIAWDCNIPGRKVKGHRLLELGRNSQSHKLPAMITIRRTSLAILALVALQLWAPGGAAQETLRYTILSNGRTAGSEADSYGKGGRVDSTFEYNDRGRGPKITAHYSLGGDGLTLRTDETGNDYLKNSVDEHFAVEEGVAHWRSTSETGQAPGSGFYISSNGAAAEEAFLVVALLKAKGAPVRLLPAGEARLERRADVTVQDHGQKLHVTDFAITGLSYEPQTVWLDDDLHYFGSPGKWFAILREGWEETNDQLYALDLAAEDSRNARLARELARRPSGPVAIEHVRLFDAEQATIRED